MLLDALLNAAEARVLGALWEKELTTPDYYPLSLHALVAACNQKSNRDPVMTLDESTVKQAMRALEAQDLAGAANTTDSRVTKYEHRLGEAFNLGRREAAILCELLLRGPQTPGELRSRAARMQPPEGSDRALFDDLDAVQSALQRLMKREPPLVKVLPHQPGAKEARYAQLLSGETAAAAVRVAEPPGAASAEMRPAGDGRRGTMPVGHGGQEAGGPGANRGANRDAKIVANIGRGPGEEEHGETDRVGRLEREVAALRAEISRVKQQVEDFRKQFE